VIRAGVAAALVTGLGLVISACGPDVDVQGAQDIANDASGGDVSDADSLYVASNLEPALAELKKRVGDDAKVDVKIEQKSLKVQAQPASGGAQSVVIGASGGAFQTEIGDFPVQGPTAAQIDPAAVERIARQVSTEAGVPLSGINYFASLAASGPPHWGVYLDDGRRWEAALDGSGVKPVG
jgi:hypothetical protein